jgi:predicted ATPase
MRRSRTSSGGGLAPPFLRRIELIPERWLEGQFPFTLPFLASGRFHLELTTAITVFVGENGTGKSTLLEAIAGNVGFNPEGGSRDHRFGDDAGSHALHEALRFSWLPKVGRGFFFRAETLFNFASYMTQVGGDDDSLHALSHGEAFLAVLERRATSLRVPSLLLLDEPEAALSPVRQLALIRILENLRNQHRTQIIIATHSPILMSIPGATLLAFEHRVRPTRLEETSHYRLYRAFLDAPAAFVARALENDAEDHGNAEPER